MARAPLTVVPSWRLGALLRSAREEAGWDDADLAARSDRFSADELQAIEQGERALDDDEIDALVELYGVDRDALVPDRDELVVDLDHHELAAAGHTQALAGTAPTPEEVLGTYLTLVYTLRAAEPGTPVRLRQADVDVLARALALAVPEVEQRLEGLMADPERVVLHQRSKLLRARVLVPAAGVLVAVVRRWCAGRLGPLLRHQGTRVPTGHRLDRGHDPDHRTEHDCRGHADIGAARRRGQRPAPQPDPARRRRAGAGPGGDPRAWRPARPGRPSAQESTTTTVAG